MIGRVAVCCNSMVPGSGAPSSAHGLRASGLREGLTDAGFVTDIVSPQNGITAQLDRWEARRMQIPRHWRILPDDKYVERINADYDAVIFPNWSSARHFKKSRRITVIYDFFSATLIEHATISDAAGLASKKADKLKIVKQADMVIANGGVQAAYAKSFVERDAGRNVTGSIPAVRLAMPWSGGTPHGERLKVFFGGFLQAWTKGITLADLELIADENDIEIHTIGLGQHLHFRSMSRAGRTRARTERVVVHGVSSFTSYQALNASSHVALDIFEPNEERENSYSTRAISSLASGCPLITMGFTEIGRMIEKTGAGWTLDTFSVDALRSLLVRLSKNRDEVEKARQNTKAFWDEYVDPVKQIAPLVAMLKRGETNVR